jgi:hypothetical protein
MILPVRISQRKVTKTVPWYVMEFMPFQNMQFKPQSFEQTFVVPAAV